MATRAVARLAWSVGALQCGIDLTYLRVSLRAVAELGGYVPPEGLHSAGELLGEQRVREAICERLREWAIG